MGFVAIVGIACIFGGVTAWIAAQKSRSALEGFALGFLFGPFGVLVEVFLPMKAQLPGGSTPSSPRWSMLNEPWVVGMIADRFQMALEEADPNWKLLPYRQRSALLKPVEKSLMEELDLSYGRFADYASEARRMLFTTRERGHSYPSVQGER